MSHDVFISYSSRDKHIADAICAKIELNSIRCWIAPRDIGAGTSWTAAIMDGISSAKVMVLVWSTHANKSLDVTREVQHAFSKNVTVIPFRIDDIIPSQDLEYYLKFVHWLDALTPPLENHLQNLVEHVLSVLPEDSRVSRSTETKPQFVDGAALVQVVRTPQNKDEERLQREVEAARRLAEKRKKKWRWDESEAMLSLAAAEERERIERGETTQPSSKNDDQTYEPANNSTQQLVSLELQARESKLRAWIIGIAALIVVGLVLALVLLK